VYQEVSVKTQRAADIAVGCFIALFGVFILYASMLITGGAAHRLPPRTFPMVVGFLLFFCGIALAVKNWSLRGADPAIPWPDGEGIRTILVTLASLSCYIALMNPLGLPLATFMYLAFSIWYLKRSKWLMALLISLITALISYYLFIRLLGLSFPAGFFLEG
jgi:putative tricarboxylic transport membrane protein